MFMTLRKSTAAIIAYAAVAGLTSVALAAFAAHGLSKVAPTGAQGVAWFTQATDFQMNHALALILIAALTDRMADGLARNICMVAAALMSVSIIFFAGSLYSLSFNGPGDLAPVGGFCAMIGWAIFGGGAILAARQGEFAARLRPQTQPAE
jgi:uncharacterized membrane protein YgdD (TMEM256/DUF423 family)